jgi:hypothetical protein
MDFDPITVTKSGSTITTAAASASVAIPTASNGEIPFYSRIAATTACYVKVGLTGLTAATGDLLVQPGDSVIVRTKDMTHVAAKYVTAAGIMQISPIEA